MSIGGLAPLTPALVVEKSKECFPVELVKRYSNASDLVLF